MEGMIQRLRRFVPGGEDRPLERAGVKLRKRDRLEAGNHLPQDPHAEAEGRSTVEKETPNRPTEDQTFFRGKTYFRRSRV